MKTLLEAERQQLIAATPGMAGQVEGDGAGKHARFATPILSMPDYLRQVEQLGRLFPQSTFTPPRGDSWRL